jgi:vanillate O-demethylase ferredoxin subunit
VSIRRLIPIHRWAALTLGLVALVSAVTGAGMAFRAQLEPLVYPREAPVGCTAPVGLDQILAAARMVHPKGKVDYLRIQRALRDPVALRYLNKDTLYFDHCTGQLLSSQNRYGGVFGMLEWIHRGQWSAAFGNVAMGLGAFTLLFMLVGIGLYLWWPRKGRRFRDALKLNRKLRKGTPFEMGLHRTIGAWVAIPLAISATTGLPNAFPFVHDAITALDGKGEARPSSTSAAGALPLSAAWDRIVHLSPDPQEALIHLAQKPGDPIEIFIIAADAPHANARTYLFLDAHDGHVLSYTPYAAMGRGSKIYYWMLSVHTGEVGGIFGQAILFLGAAGALVLGFTGIRTWARRRAKKSRPRAAATGPAATA